MRKFRVVIRERSGRKHTRHVRAVDGMHASEQALAIIEVICKGEPAAVYSVVEMGRAS